MSFRLSSIYKSLIRHLVDTIEAVKDADVSPDLHYYAWDSRDDEAEMDRRDLIGLAGWTFKENNGLWIIETGITLSTVDDENLFREVAILDIIHDFWGEQTSIPMRDADTGLTYTNLITTGFEIMPTGTSEKRNYRPIGIDLLRTDSGT